MPAVAAQSDDQALRDLWSEQAEACDVAGEKYCLADEAFHAPRVASTTLGPHHSPHAPGAGGHGLQHRDRTVLCRTGANGMGRLRVLRRRQALARRQREILSTLLAQTSRLTIVFNWPATPPTGGTNEPPRTLLLGTGLFAAMGMSAKSLAMDASLPMKGR